MAQNKSVKDLIKRQTLEQPSHLALQVKTEDTLEKTEWDHG